MGVLGLLLLLAPAPGRADDFYVVRLRVGQEDYRGKRYREATDNFRIAVFGFLERPELLSQALARLALAQVAAGKEIDADATLAKFLVVERQFNVYSKVQLDPPVRAEFEALLSRRASAEALRGLPGLARLAGGARN
jgi:hypothetical protein